MHVPGRVLHRGNGVPPLPHARERFLREVLGLLTAARDHAQDLEQVIPLIDEELVEGGWLLGHDRAAIVPLRSVSCYLSHPEGVTNGRGEAFSAWGDRSGLDPPPVS